MENQVILRQSQHRRSILRAEQAKRFAITCLAWTGPIICLACMELTATAQAQESTVSRQSVSIDGIGFEIPEGTRLEKVADQPFIRWPVAADWDRDGSLVVLESNWNRESVQQQLDSKPHRLVRLSDSNRDGRFDKRKVIADQLSFSAGVLVYEDAIFVSSPPTIFKLTDPDEDGFYDQRDAWYDGGTLTHCANDLHGPFLGPDGWIYWTKGAFAQQQYQTLLGKTVTSTAAHLLRRHPAGGPVDILMTGGMDNPVDLAFLPNGERIFCSTFMHHPGNGLRDGIGHAIYGSLFGKSHAPVEDHFRTGPLFNPIAELGPAAPASVMTVGPRTLTHQISFFRESDQPYDSIICCQFNLQRLSIHQLIASGGSYTTVSEDLITADRVDFHPVDCLEEPNGSLLILDTGGWYDLCCPSSGTPGQIAPGGIYRLSLVDSNADPAINSSEPADPASKQQSRSLTETASVWRLARTLISDPNNASTRDAILAKLEGSDDSTRQAALNVVSLYRWEEARPYLINILRASTAQASLSGISAHSRRLAAESLGRLGNPTAETLEALLLSLETQQPDRTADHAILYAVIELNAKSALRQALASDSARRQWAALIGLQQLEAINPQDIDRLFELAQSTTDFVRTQTIETLASQPQLAAAAASTLESLWQADNDSTNELLQAVLIKWAAQPTVQDLVAHNLKNWSTQSNTQQTHIQQAIAGMRGSKLPESWRMPLGKLLSDPTDLPESRENVVGLALALQGIVWSLPEDSLLLQKFIDLADDPSLDLATKLHLLSLLPSRTTGVPERLVSQVLQGVVDQNSGQANRCVAVLSRLELTAQQAEELMLSLKELPASNLQETVVAILSVNDPTLDQQLIQTLPDLDSARALSIPTIESALAKRPEATRQAFTRILREIHTPTEDIESTVNQFLAKLPPGDAVEGYQVFRSTKASCASCHRVGYVGGRIGPELTRIGRSRSKYDLAEAILYPSARLEQSYQSTRVLTGDGRVINGLLTNLSSTHLELTTGAEKTEIIPLEAIEQREPSPLSIMPTGLETTLTPQQFADLLAFLQAAR